MSFHRFLELPRELRDVVYSCLLPSTDIIHPLPAAPRHSSTIVAVMCASKQLHREAREALYLSVTLTLHHYNDHVRGRRQPRQTRLPTTPLLEAKNLRINVMFVDHTRYVSELLNPLRSADTEKEYLVSSVPAEMVALTAVLRRRAHLPCITVCFNFAATWNRQHRPFPRTVTAPTMAALLMRPLRSLTRVPGGVELQLERPLDGVVGWAEEIQELVRGVKDDTEAMGARKELTEGEKGVLEAHEEYLCAKEEYDEWMPWEWNERKWYEEGGELLRMAMRRAQDVVGEWRAERLMRVSKWAREGEE